MGLAGLGMYALAGVVFQARYVGAFFILLWLGLYSGVAIPSGRDKLSVVSLITLAVVIAMLTPVAMDLGVGVVQSYSGVPNLHWQGAEDVRRLGVVPGDRVARIGGDPNVGWARLLGVTIVAEVPRDFSSDFWCAKPEVQAQVIEAFRNLGVSAIVAERTSPHDIQNPGPGWTKSIDGVFYVFKFSPTRGS